MVYSPWTKKQNFKVAGQQGTGVHILSIVLSHYNSLIYTELYFLSLQGKRQFRMGGWVGVYTYTYLPVKMLNRLYDSIPIIVIYKGQKNESNEIYCFVP